MLVSQPLFSTAYLPGLFFCVWYPAMSVSKSLLPLYDTVADPDSPYPIVDVNKNLLATLTTKRKRAILYFIRACRHPSMSWKDYSSFLSDEYGLSLSLRAHDVGHFYSSLKDYVDHYYRVPGADKDGNGFLTDKWDLPPSRRGGVTGKTALYRRVLPVDNIVPVTSAPIDYHVWWCDVCNFLLGSGKTVLGDYTIVGKVISFAKAASDKAGVSFPAVEAGDMFEAYATIDAMLVNASPRHDKGASKITLMSDEMKRMRDALEDNPDLMGVRSMADLARKWPDLCTYLPTLVTLASNRCNKRGSLPAPNTELLNDKGTPAALVLALTDYVFKSGDSPERVYSTLKAFRSRVTPAMRRAGLKFNNLVKGKRACGTSHALLGDSSHRMAGVIRTASVPRGIRCNS